MKTRKDPTTPGESVLSPDIIPLVLPDDGIEPVLDLIRSAQSTLLVKQFSFTHPEILEEILEAHRRGVLVRVMLNPARPDGRCDNAEFRQKMIDEGISVRWTNPKYLITHEKTVIIDNEKALIATFNFNPKSFGETRDYGVIITNISQVADMIACFTADWRRAGFNSAPDTGLFWSCQNSRQTIIRFLDSAVHTLDIQHPKLVDTTMIERILDAHDRGVKVRFLCGGKKGMSEFTLTDTLASFRLLQKFGIPVRKLGRGLRMHSKFILADGSRAMLSSMNLCRDSFEYRREIGIIFGKGPALERFASVFNHDWEEGKNWVIPDALSTIGYKWEDEELSDDPDYTED
jgi:cardiolipin synthase A/B